MDCFPSKLKMTYRFTVNLPQNQKKVLRISPKETLGEIRQNICKEKGFDPSRYVFRLPSNPNDTVDDLTSVGDLKTSEINFVAVAMIEAASSRSMPDLAFAATREGAEAAKYEAYMPQAGEKKAKKGFLSFLRKDNTSKFKVQQEAMDMPRSKKSETLPARPQTIHIDSGELDHFGLRKTTGDLHKYQDYRRSVGAALGPVNESATQVQSQKIVDTSPPKKSGKKRAAPPPPQAKPQTVQVEINVQPKQAGNRIEEVAEVRMPLKKIHSRNSSDSSGYHELTVSGAESPDANKTDNLQTTLDTTSIDSVEHFNGDSGIRDMSPVTRRSTSRVSEAGDGKKPVVPGRKKKRAPLPPSEMAGSRLEDNVEEETEYPPTPCEAHVQEEEFSALQAMEEVTMKFDLPDSDDDDDDDDMKMVENSSVHSEDVDVDNMGHRQRPALFVPPPPPTEPPPEDSQPVNLNMLVNRVDIGVGEGTTNSSPSSAKSSTRDIPSRPDSRSSNSSVNTIEDLSLAFNQTIALGEETLASHDYDDDDSDVEDELKREMPEFRKHITRLSLDGPDDSPVSSDWPEMTADSDRPSGRDSPVAVESTRSSEANKETSEITYGFTVDSVPPDFQNTEPAEISNTARTDSSEDSFIQEEVVEYLPAQPGVLDLGSPRKIPDLDSPKEHKSLSLPPPSLQKEETEIVEKTVDINIDNDTADEVGEKFETEETKEPEKEEFVISLDELSNVDFSAMKPEEHRKPKKEVEVPKVNYRIEFRSSLNSDRDYEEPQPFYNDTDVPDAFDGSVKDKCSELSFTPNSEGEAEHLLEEKSISMIALPAERTPVKKQPSVDSTSSKDMNSDSSFSVEVSPRSDDSTNLMQAQYEQLQQQFAMWQNQLVQNQKLLANSDVTTSPMGQDDSSNLQLQQLQLQIQMQQQMMLQLQQSMQTIALQSSLVSPQAVTKTQAISPRIEPARIEPVMSTPVASSPSVPAPPPPPPPAPTPPAVKATNSHASIAQVSNGQVSTSKPKPSKADAKYTKPKIKKYERELEPREQLMLDIRNFGKVKLNKVPVKATHWHK